MKKYICHSCKIEKLLSEFYSNYRKKLGHEYDCKDCFKKRRMVYYSTPEGKIKNALSSYKSLKKIKLNKPERIMLWAAKTRAKKNGLEFDLTLDNIIIPSHCPVLGIPLEFSKNKRQKDNSPSIDRIDSTKGYTINNIKIISWRANAIKKDASLEEIEKILKYMKNNV